MPTFKKYIKTKIPVALFVLYAMALISADYGHAETGYSLSAARISVASGDASSENYSLCDAAIGGIFGGLSESENYTLQAGYLFFPQSTIAVIPLRWDVDSIAPGERIINSPDGITIKNSGNVKLAYGAYVRDMSARPWFVATDPGSNGYNRFSMGAIFTGIDVTSVEEDDFGMDDFLSESLQYADGSKFAVAGSVENGIDVLPGAERVIWLKFSAPLVDTTQEDKHNLWLIIEAKEVN